MAQPSTVLNDTRRRVTSLVESLYEVDAILHVIEDTGADDGERAAFFASYIDTQEAYDITSAEFLAAAVTLRELRTWLETNRPILAKLRA